VRGRRREAFVLFMLGIIRAEGGYVMETLTPDVQLRLERLAVLEEAFISRVSQKKVVSITAKWRRPVCKGDALCAI
jgi:hypothetical protein